MNYRSVEDLNRAVCEHLHHVPTDVRLVVGVPRSGLLAANLLALHLNLPLTDVDGLLAGRLLHGGVRSSVADVNAALGDDGRVLVIDDSVCTGDAMATVRRRLAPIAAQRPISFAAIYIAPESPELTDFSFEVVPTPRIFEWNALHHGLLPRACIDIDGVLCPDPTPQENDDGERYRRFLDRAPLRVRPDGEIGWLVTSRLEKYRSDTEAWLQRHRIRYRDLIMLDLPDQATRQRLRAAAPFKAQAYRETRADLFIESDLSQARVIAHLTGRDVFCVANGRLVRPDHLSRLRSGTRAWIGRTHWRLRRAARRWHQPYIAPAPGAAGSAT